MYFEPFDTTTRDEYLVLWAKWSGSLSDLRLRLTGVPDTLLGGCFQSQRGEDEVGLRVRKDPGSVVALLDWVADVAGLDLFPPPVGKLPMASASPQQQARMTAHTADWVGVDNVPSGTLPSILMAWLPSATGGGVVVEDTLQWRRARTALGLCRVRVRMRSLPADFTESEEE